MVRRMVYVQVLVGQQRLGLEKLAEAVEKAAPLPPGLAPPQGLALKEVFYGQEARPRAQGTMDED
jgi:tRNA U38,U39,U40 pseudouridine synthase TruA